MTKYRVYEPHEELPARVKKGRRPSVNNDSILVALGLKGYLEGQYKSFNHAARDLAPQARQSSFQKIDGKYVSEYVLPATDIPNVIRRLAKKISKAHKDWLHAQDLQK